MALPLHWFGPVAPRPAHRDRRVVEVVNVVVRDRIAAALPHPHADRGGVHGAEIVDLVVGDGVLHVAGRLRRGRCCVSPIFTPPAPCRRSRGT